MVYKVNIFDDCNYFVKADSKKSCKKFIEDEGYKFEVNSIAELTEDEIEDVTIDYFYQTDQLLKCYLSDILKDVNDGIITDDFVCYR